MKNSKKTIIGVCITVIAATALIFAGITSVFGDNQDAPSGKEILKNPVQIADSGYTMSSLRTDEKSYTIVLTGKISDNPTPFESLPMMSYGDSDYDFGGVVEPSANAYTHQGDDFAMELVYDNPSNDVTWINFSFAYTDANGEPQQFTTPDYVVGK